MAKQQTGIQHCWCTQGWDCAAGPQKDGWRTPQNWCGHQGFVATTSKADLDNHLTLEHQVVTEQERKDKDNCIYNCNSKQVTLKKDTPQLSWRNQKAGSLSSSHFCVPLPLSVQAQILPHGGRQQIIFTHHPTIKLIQQQQQNKIKKQKKSVYFELFYLLICLGQFNLVTKFHSACCSFRKNNSYTPNWGNHSFGFRCSSLW